jgi:hypothetical protein
MIIRLAHHGNDLRVFQNFSQLLIVYIQIDQHCLSPSVAAQRSLQFKAYPQTRPKSNRGLVNVTPTPVFARLKRLDNRMAGLVKMLGGVLIG